VSVDPLEVCAAIVAQAPVAYLLSTVRCDCSRALGHLYRYRDARFLWVPRQRMRTAGARFVWQAPRLVGLDEQEAWAALLVCPARNCEAAHLATGRPLGPQPAGTVVGVRFGDDDSRGAAGDSVYLFALDGTEQTEVVRGLVLRRLGSPRHATITP